MTVNRVEVPQMVINIILASVLAGQRYPKEDPKNVVEMLMNIFFEKEESQDGKDVC